MGKFIDLTGQKFGKWTVLKKSDIRKSNKIYWVCQCECGTIKDVCGGDLRSHKNKSCGCTIKEKESPNFINELGNKYGRLTVIERAENDSKKDAKWICQCECGKKTIVAGYSLRSGNTKSCGCLQKEDLSKRVLKDLSGQKFGFLTVLYQNGRSPSQEVIWHCKCDCGNEKDVLASSLTKSKTISCGCSRRSLGEYKIEQILKENNISFIQEYSPSKKELSFRGRFDFYLPKIDVLIEYDGEQHYIPKEYFGGEKEFKIRKQHDELKNEWALKYNHTLIRIPYTHYNDLCIEDLLPNTSSFIINK